MGVVIIVILTVCLSGFHSIMAGVTASAQRNNNVTLTERDYFNLIDAMHNATAAIQQLSKEQLELRNTVKTLTIELKTANHRVTMLENETMASVNQSQHLLNEMHNITEDYNTLKKSHDALQIKHQNDSMKQRSDWSVCLNETKHLKKSLHDLQTEVNFLKSNNIARQDDFIAISKVVLKGEQDIALLRTNINDLYTFCNKSNDYDNKISHIEKTVLGKIQNVTEANNITVQSLLEKIENLEVKSSSQEANMSQAIQQLSEHYKTDINKVELEFKDYIKVCNTSVENIGNTLEKLDEKSTSLSLNMTQNINAISTKCEQHITHIQTEIDELHRIHNNSVKTYSTGLYKLDERTTSLETNLTQALNELESEIQQNISLIAMETRNNLMMLEEKHNTSLENVLKDIARLSGLSNFLGSSLKNALHRISTISNQNSLNISRIEQKFNNEVQTLKERQNTSVKALSREISELDIRTNNMEYNITGTVHQLSITTKNLSKVESELQYEVQSSSEHFHLCMVNITKMENEHKMKVATLIERLNTTEHNMLSDIEELKRQTQVLQLNQTDSMLQMLNEFNTNLSSVEVELKREIHKSNLNQNISSITSNITRGIDTLNGRLSIFELDVTRAIQHIGKEQATNVSKVEMEFKTIIQKSNEQNNKSIHTIMNKFEDLERKSKIAELNLTQAIQQLSTKTDHGMSIIKHGLQQEVLKLTQNHNMSVQSFSSRVDTLDSKLNALESNLSRAAHQTSADQEQGKII